MLQIRFKNIAILLILALALPLGQGMVLAATDQAQGPNRPAAGDTPQFNPIWNYNPSLVTTVYARDGSILGYLYREKRFLVNLMDLPPMLIKSFLAAEDASFYEHEGVDLQAIFRAMGKNIKAGDIVQGGSTITQQVVKRLLLSTEKTYGRKLKEAILAYRLERFLSKEDILSIYLNEIFFGAQAYGIEAAAQTYFAKHASELNLAESALLAGLPKAPSSYNPFRHPEAAKQRQRYVLGRLLELKWITREQYDTALAAPLEYKSMEDPSWTFGAYYLEEVRRELIQYFSQENMERLGFELESYGEDALYSMGLHVHTALDPVHQRAADKALREGLEASSKRRGWLGPVKHLESAEYKAFLDNTPWNATTAQGLATGDRVQALVLEVSKNEARVRVGELAGFIPVSSMGWCRTPNPKAAPEDVAKIQDARKVLAKGDVVWTSVIESRPPPGGLVLALEQHPEIQGALVSLDPQNGDVLALAGGYDFTESQFNRATQAFRQPGSAFKPIVYSAALDNGFTAASVVNDEPQIYLDPQTRETWEPKNYSGKYYGPTMLVTALVHSRNLVTVQVAKDMGIEKVVQRAKDFHLKGHFPPYLAVSLGAVAITPMNLCQAYTVFARGGTGVNPRLILFIKDKNGQDFFRSQVETWDAVKPENAYIITHLLKEVVQRGTGARAKALGRPVAGKTGTTNDEKDAWFIGFSPYLLSGVYVGFDQIRPMGRRETGSRAALPIWLAYRTQVEELYAPQDFTEPPGIVFEPVPKPGTQVEVWDEDAPPKPVDTVLLPFIFGTQPSMNPDLEEIVPETEDELFKEFF